jgi:hypothetical protein
MKSVKKGIVKARRVTFGMLVIAVVTAFAFGAVVPPASATTIPATQTITSYGQDFVVNYDNITIWLDGEDSTILVGQVIQFYNATGGPSGKVTLTGVSGKAEDEGDVKSTGSDGRLETTLKTGKYEVRCDDPSYGCNVTNISVSSVDLELKLKSGTKTVSSIPQGTCIRIKFTGLDPAEHDGITLKVTNPSGDTVKVNPADGTVFDKVNVAHITDLEINTEGWELGTYKFKVATEEEYARGLDEESDKKN